jgi:hypothetical protein
MVKGHPQNVNDFCKTSIIIIIILFQLSLNCQQKGDCAKISLIFVNSKLAKMHTIASAWVLVVDAK